MGTENVWASNSYGTFQPYSMQITKKRLDDRDAQKVEEGLFMEKGIMIL